MSPHPKKQMCVQQRILTGSLQIQSRSLHVRSYVVGMFILMPTPPHYHKLQQQRSRQSTVEENDLQKCLGLIYPH